MDFTKEEIEILISGIRLQIDECDKNRTHYDPTVRELFNNKSEKLYLLWKKLEQPDG
jgi:hypothetical protein